MKIIFVILLLQAGIFARILSVDTIRVPAGAFTSPSAVWHHGIPSQPKVIVWFHGGMQSTNCEKGLIAGNSLASLISDKSSLVVLSASACESHHWLSTEALQVTDALMDSLEVRWKVKIMEVSLIGISDGGLGVLGYTLQGKRKVVSRMLISTNLTRAVDPQSLAAARRSQTGTWLFLQGGRDQLYSPEMVYPWLDSFCQSAGSKRCELKIDPRGEHDWSWWLQNRKEWLLGFLNKAFP
jgi:pimeloyl-ACP methyl ester carboxylesterase